MLLKSQCLKSLNIKIVLFIVKWAKIFLLLWLSWSLVWWLYTQSVCWCCRRAGPVCTGYM